jgi:hypothetical protein
MSALPRRITGRQRGSKVLVGSATALLTLVGASQLVGAARHPATNPGHDLSVESLAIPCIVDVSDWPPGALPDDAVAAAPGEQSAATTCCRPIVMDWPVGVLPDDASAAFGTAACAHAWLTGAEPFDPPS